MSIIKRIGQVIGVLILISLFWSIFMGDNETPTGKTTQIISSESTPAIEKSESTSVKKEIKTVSISEKVIVDDISYIVDEIKTFTYVGDSEFFRTKADGIFYVIYLTIENLGKETQNIFTPRFKLVDDQDRRFDQDTEAEFYRDDTIKLGEQLQPNLPVKGTIIFDLPKTAKGLKLEIRGDWLSVEKVLVDLGK